MITSHKLLQKGSQPEDADKVLIMIHGRGGSPEDIVTLAPHLHPGAAWILAPRAKHQTWYPYSFMAPESSNQPWLDDSLSIIDQTVQTAVEANFKASQIYFLGFSQGACLMLEYATRHAQRWGGIIAFTGGLIGETINRDRYSGNFEGTPIHLSAGDRDPHVPMSRIEETADIITNLQGDLQQLIYHEKPHSISGDELIAARRHIFGVG